MRLPSLRRLMNKSRSSSRGSGDENPEREALQHSHGNDDAARQFYRLHNPMCDMTTDHVDHLNDDAQDYILCCGGLLKAVTPTGDVPYASGRVVGISLRPSPFPKRLFDEACKLQTIFQELYIAVTRDPIWLRDVLKGLVKTDPLMNVLWEIHEESHTRRTNGKISAGVFRSDYMLHSGPGLRLGLKQVEFNTIACAGSLHGQRVADLHHHLYERGVYNDFFTNTGGHLPGKTTLEIPGCENKKGICETLQVAYHAYLDRFGGDVSEASAVSCILMVVQPRNFNIADERPIEYEMWSRNPPIPCFRVEWQDVLDCVSLSPNGNLLLHSPNHVNPYTVAVIYLRAGFEPFEYEERMGFETRLMFEISNAVVCPDILTHLVGSKKVQQALCEPGSLEHFINVEKAETLRNTFMEMYPLDTTDLGIQGQKLATDPATAISHVLKPSRDGGGNNLYGDTICTFLGNLPKDRWAEYILMERIEPVVAHNALVSSRGVWLGDVVAELGIWGGCVWEHREQTFGVVMNGQCGWSVRSKNPSVNEMSVVKGYGCFDSVVLVGDEIMQKSPQL